MARYSGGAAVAPPGGASTGKPPKPAQPSKPSKPPGTPIQGRPPAPRPPAPPSVAAPTRGHWVPVGDKWVLIHATGKDQWAQGAVPGARAPARPQGPTPMPSNPLAPLAPGQIRRTATATITGAYKPEFTDLTQQQSTAQNVYKTQSTDAKYFADWLAQKGEEMTGAVGAVNGQLVNLARGINEQTQAQQGQVSQMQAANQALTGGNAQNTYEQQLPQVLAGQDLRNQGNEKTAAERAMLGPVDVAQVAGVNQARVQALRGQEFDQLNKAMQNIAQNRTKLLQAQTGDIAKEIARLQGVELQKRQFLISQSALEGQLKLKQGAQYATNLLNEGKLKIAQQGANTAAARVTETNRHNMALEKINSGHYADQTARNAALDAERARHNKAMEGISQQNANTGAARGAGGVGGKPAKPATPAQQRTVRNSINTLVGALKRDYQKYHANDPNGWSFAYHDLLNGNAFKAKIAPTFTGDTALLNAALNIAKGYGLTRGDVAYLQQQGLTNIGGYYQIHSGSSAPQGGVGNRG